MECHYRHIGIDFTANHWGIYDFLFYGEWGTEFTAAFGWRLMLVLDGAASDCVVFPP